MALHMIIWENIIYVVLLVYLPFALAIVLQFTQKRSSDFPICKTSHILKSSNNSLFLLISFS